MSGKNLVILTNHFPYGSGETFLESEVPWLVQSFSKVVVITKAPAVTASRFVAPNFFISHINLKSSLAEKIFSLWLFVTRINTSFSCLLNELSYLRSKNKSIRSGMVSTMLHDLLKALLTSKHIEDEIKKHQLTGTVVLYSYWFNASALATTLAKVNKTNIQRVTRVHGGDLYQDLHPHSYLSFRQVTAAGLDRIYPTSNLGAQVLQEILDTSLHSKIEVTRLGTRPPNRLPVKNQVDELVVVSCSSMKEIKRLHLIIESIALTGLPIRWIHFGDGPLREQLQALAEKKLTGYRYEWKGAVTNQALYDFYEHQYVDLFLNTSFSEGIPVSIMETQSFGIPCVATNVGGNAEIISDRVGMLVSQVGNPVEIAEAIVHLLTLSPNEKEKMRSLARQNWDDHYNSSKNYATFSAKLLNL